VANPHSYIAGGALPSLRDLLRGARMVACLALLACGSERVPEDPVPDTALAEPPSRPGLRFDPATTTRGTVIGALTVDSIDAQRAHDSTFVGTARFSGQIELSGATIRNFDPDLRGTLTCFEADSSSSARLPRWSADERRSWFCFTNNDDAARALGPPSDSVRATIVVDSFTIHRNLSDAVNSARFVRLVAGGVPR
jgi:hypothetical protein